MTIITQITAAERTAIRLELLAERLGRRISDVAEAARWDRWRADYGAAAAVRANRAGLAADARAVRELADELRERGA